MLWWTVQNLVVTAALAGVVWLVCKLFRIGPAARHALWLVVLVKMLTPPLVAWPWAVGNAGWLSENPPAAIVARNTPAVPLIPIHPPIEWTRQVPSPEQPGVILISNGGADAVGATFVDPADTPPPMVMPAPESDRIGPPRPSQPRAIPDRSMTAAPPPAGLLPAMPPERERPRWSDWLRTSLGWTWSGGAAVFALIQAIRIVRMVRRLRGASPAGQELAEQVAAMAEKLGVPAPQTRLVRGIGSPAIFSLSHPVLLWPAELATQSRGAIRGLIVHELAHIRRRDHWVGWVELIAGCVWWWNPLFWYVRHHLRENAELACDGWVVDTLPGGRRAYAEGLLTVCEFISKRLAPIPVVGVNTGGRRFLERRLAMIMKEQVSLRIGRIGIAIIALLGATALPAWSQYGGRAATAEEGKKIVVEGGLETGSGVVFGDYIDVAGLPRAERSRLPADAADILSRFQQQQNLATMNAIRELYALEQRYLVQGLPGQAPAIRERIQQLQQTLAAPGVPGSGVLPDPGTLTGHRGQNGTSLVFQVTGDPNAGSVWGSDIYTDDSTLASVVVHAGLLRSGETGNVRVDILAGQESYVGCTKNGVTSSSYQSWQGSYRVSRAAAAAAVPSLGEYRGRNNESLTFDITGDAKAGTVWGGDFNIYTDDSNLATAVVHAGLVKDGEHARVKVTILPGRDQYPAIKRNEIESHPWGSWDGSYRIEAATTNKLDRLTRPRTLRTYGSPPGMTAPSPGMPELSQYRGKGNTTMMVEVTGSTDGVVWGEDVYTDDSSIATAAVHAGVLKAGEKGLIAVTTLPGQKSYKGSEKNGVTTSDYAEWGGSFTLERADGKRLAEPRSKGRTETPKLHSYTFGLER